MRASDYACEDCGEFSTDCTPDDTLCPECKALSLPALPGAAHGVRVNACRCSHPSAHHGTRGDRHCSRILHPGCGCDEFRPRAPVADEAEEWLAARTPAAGEDAATGTSG